MSIRLATLLPGHFPLGVGINQSRRGFVQCVDGAQLQAVIKAVPPLELAAELFCSLLGRCLQLPIPEPLIVRDPESGSLMFGGIQSLYPNLLQAFNLPPNATNSELIPIVERLQKWPQVGEVVWFDEWIKNVDRNLTNLLWDGGETFILIDHGLSLGIADSRYHDSNKLVELLLIPITTNQVEIQKLKSRVLNASVEFGIAHAKQSAAELRLLTVDNFGRPCEAFIQLLSARLPHLAGLVARRFPSPQLTLNI